MPSTGASSAHNEHWECTVICCCFIALRNPAIMAIICCMGALLYTVVLGLALSDQRTNHAASIDISTNSQQSYSFQMFQSECVFQCQAQFLTGVRLRELINRIKVSIVRPENVRGSLGQFPPTGMCKYRVCMGVKTGLQTRR